jgi:hypothetical protein
MMPLERVRGDPAIKLEGVAFGMRDVDDAAFNNCKSMHTTTFGRSCVGTLQLDMQKSWKTH